MDFLNHEIYEQVRSGHAVVFPLSAICGLPNLWLSPVAAILQAGRRPHLIFYFTWSSLNKATDRKAPEEVMRFRCTLHHIIRRVLTADPRLGPIYLEKVYLADAYMHIWFRI